MTPSISASRTYLASAIASTAGMALTVGSALGFQHIGGYIPCQLCLMQREPYYYALPVGILAVAAALMKLPTRITRILLLVVGLAMIIGAGMGVYHSGVEWGFWEGPSSCGVSAVGMSMGSGDILGQLNSVHGPSCTVAALRVLGLSFAGWNVLASLVLAAIAFYGASRKPA